MPLDAPVTMKTSLSCQQNAVQDGEKAHLASLIWEVLLRKSWSGRKELR